MGAKILIIEDDEIFLRNLSKFLRSQKHRIFVPNQLTDAKKIVRRKDVDVVLLDLRTLKYTGLALLEEIKGIRPDTEVILINCPTQLALSIEGMKLGAFDDLLVPFDLDSLLKPILMACEQKRKRPKKKSFIRRSQDLMTAVSFAEAGAHDVAREIIRPRNESNEER